MGLGFRGLGFRSSAVCITLSKLVRSSLGVGFRGLGLGVGVVFIPCARFQLFLYYLILIPVIY